MQRTDAGHITITAYNVPPGGTAYQPIEPVLTAIAGQAPHTNDLKEAL